MLWVMSAADTFIAATCEECQQQEATVHIQEIIGSRKKTHHFCAACAEAKGLNPENLQGLDLAAMLLKMAQKDLAGEAAGASGTASARPAAVRRCRQCGLTEKEFTRLGRLGCPGCYTAFAEIIDPLIREIQSGLRHVGKVPGHGAAVTPPAPPAPPAPPVIADAMPRLESELKQAVQAEAYEKAAQLRDDIRRLREEQHKLRNSA